MMNYNPSVIRVCLNCLKAFRVYSAHLRGGAAGKYCTKSCAAKHTPKTTKRQLQKVCCECGSIFSIQKHREFTANFCSRECRRRSCGRFNGGENHPKWKGGISHRPQAQRVLINRAIKEIGKCQECGNNQDLCGHHIKSYEHHPELRLDRNNIQVLCRPCHAEKHPEIRNFILKGKHYA